MFAPIPISEIPDPIPVDWLWEGYLAPNSITLLVGLWKSGKSTLLGHLLSCFSQPGPSSLGPSTRPARCLLISEEHISHWSRRRSEFRILGGSTYLHCQPSSTRFSFSDWSSYLSEVAAFCISTQIELVIFDTIAGIWPVSDENSATEIAQAMIPLQHLSKMNCSVLLVHHSSKIQRREGRSARGSGAIPASVDIIMEFRRHGKPRDTTRQRQIKCFSRFPDSPVDLVLEYAEDGSGYSLLGDSAEADDISKAAVLQANLPIGPPGLPLSEILSLGLPFSRSVLYSLLKAGTDRGHWVCSGSGSKGDPIRYFRPT